VLAFVLFARLRARRRWMRGLMSALSVGVLASLFAYAFVRGPSGPPESQLGIVDFVSELANQEYETSQ
jgi:multisubunit Na+/H+ antiporter MnhB subunit